MKTEETNNFDESKLDEEGKMFLKVLRETKSLSKTMDFMEKWVDEHGGPKFTICTNNIYEAELEEAKHEYYRKKREEEVRNGTVKKSKGC